MKKNRSVPPSTVVPILAYPDVTTAVAFLTAAFGFVERTRIGEDHRAQMAVGFDGAVIVADIASDRSTPEQSAHPHMIRVRVDDVEAAFARARDAGAVVVEAPVDREYGERDCTLVDPGKQGSELCGEPRRCGDRPATELHGAGEEVVGCRQDRWCFFVQDRRARGSHHDRRRRSSAVCPNRRALLRRRERGLHRA